MTNRRETIFAFSSLVLTGGLLGCVAPKKTENTSDYFIEFEPNFALKIGELIVNNHYKIPQNAQNIEYENKYISAELFTRLLNTRYKKQGLLGKITLVIEEYSLIEEKFAINSSTLSLFSSEAGSKITAKWRAKLICEAPNFQSTLNIDVNDQITIGKESSLKAREKEIYQIGQRLLSKFDTKLIELTQANWQAIMVK